jgi:urocanate hydratase
LTEACQHKLTVGSAARILYADQRGRVAIAVAINQAVKSGTLKVRDKTVNSCQLFAATSRYVTII